MATTVARAPTPRMEDLARRRIKDELRRASRQVCVSFNSRCAVVFIVTHIYRQSMFGNVGGDYAGTRMDVEVRVNNKTKVLIIASTFLHREDYTAFWTADRLDGGKRRRSLEDRGVEGS